MTSETKEIEIDGIILRYELRRTPRAKRIGIRIYPGPEEGGLVVLTVPPRGSVRSGERFLRDHAEWVLRQSARMAGRGPLLHRVGEHDYRRRRIEAAAFIREKVAKWNLHYGFRHGSMTIRNQSTRWGSCSHRGNLSFNWKLLLLPERMADYVVVHELCHLEEFNHSAKFWKLVAQAVPEYREIVREMRRL
ncbi:MAG: M48 family metallopeptidase [Candidatus Moranbacteria bacterium]|nr:M48 family metallopeptidase [Candidatus Moranbacteria bacterium]